MKYNLYTFNLANRNVTIFGKLFNKDKSQNGVNEFLKAIDEINENPMSIVVYNVSKFRKIESTRCEQIEQKIKIYNQNTDPYKKIVIDNFFDFKKIKNVGDLFNNTPGQFGLRGDHELWEDLRLKLKDIKLPSNEENLLRIINNAIFELTDNNLIDRKKFFVDKYFHGSGMSGGIVSSDWWIEQGLPLLIGRWKENCG